MFFIPEGVDELVYAEDESFLFNEEEMDEADAAVLQEESDLDLPDEEDYADNPDAPQVLQVLNPQTLRTADTGAEVVDVVLEVDDIEDVTNYEVRVVKV